MDSSELERYTPLPYDLGNAEIGIYEVFEDPDFIDLKYGLPTQRTEITWATGKNALEAANAFQEFITWNNGKKGNILLARRKQDVGASNNINALRGSSSDILDEVRENHERVIGFFVANEVMRFNWQPSWPKAYHDIKTAEVEVTIDKKSKHSREVIEKCLAQTALPGLINVSGETLDYFSRYVPALEKR